MKWPEDRRDRHAPLALAMTCSLLTKNKPEGIAFGLFGLFYLPARARSSQTAPTSRAV